MSEGSSLFRWFAKGKLTTLTFHKIPEERDPLLPAETTLKEFERILQVVVKHFRILPLNEAVTCLRAGNLPPASACLTFDDGYRNWIDGVVPMLESYGVPATFFVTVDQLHGRPLWNERILHALRCTNEDTQPLQLEGLPLLFFNSLEERRKSLQILDRTLKYQDHNARHELITKLEEHSNTLGHEAPSFNVNNLKEIINKGFEVGAHSLSHPILKLCNEKQAYLEIAGAKEELEALTGKKITAFAYPNGQPDQDFDAGTISIVHRAGYRCALTTSRGTANGMTPVMQIPRFTPWGPTQKKVKFQLLQNLLRKNSYIKEESKNKKRILMVAFHYPPQSGSSGLQRTLSFTKYLPTQGWNTEILTVKPIAYEECNNSLIDNIPTDTVIRRTQAFDAARHFSIRKKYPRLLALPDRWASWWLPAIWSGVAAIKENRPDFIWSTYPLASAHLIGACLSRLCKLPWIADFRDPMVSEAFPQDRLQRAFWKALERHVLKEANACLFTTLAAANSYKKRYPEAATKIIVVENGYDEEAFEKASPRRYGIPTDMLLMLHSGIIYPEERDPSNFFAAVRELLDREVISPEKLVIRFRAPVHGDAVISRASRLGIERCVEIAPPISYVDAISEMMGADLLLIFQGTNFNTQVPAKLYEYLRSGKPIFGALDLSGETSKIMRQFKSLALGDINSINHIRCCLEQQLRGIKSSETIESMIYNIQQVKKYSRRSQAMKMAEALQRLDERL